MNIDPLEGKALAATRVPTGCTIVAFDGAIRSSKTISSLLLWCEYVRTAPAGELLLTGRTETAVIQNVVLPLQEMLGPSRVVLNRGTGTVMLLGRLHTIVGANDEQARTKIQGRTLAGAYLDEAANVPESFFNMLRTRLSIPGAMLFLTCNPEGPKHWLLTKWLMRAMWWLDKKGEVHHNPAGLSIWRVTFVLDDNTWLARNNPAFVAELKQSWPKGSMFYMRYIESEWVSSDGAVYEMWNAETMGVLRSQLPPMERILTASVDYGTEHRTRGYLLGLCRVPVDESGRLRWGKRDPNAYYDPSRMRAVLVTLREFAPPKLTVGEHARLFEDWLRVGREQYGVEEWVPIDPAAAVFKAELFARGIDNVMNAHNRVLPGIQTVASLLATGRLFVVSDECPLLMDAVPAYMWDTKATERGKTEPLKQNDDEVDAWRYGVFTSRRDWRDQIPLAPINESADDEEQD